MGAYKKVKEKGKHWLPHREIDRGVWLASGVARMQDACEY